MYGLIQTHPDAPERPLVDFDIALTFIPALLLGVSFGAPAARLPPSRSCAAGPMQYATVAMSFALQGMGSCQMPPVQCMAWTPAYDHVPMADGARAGVLLNVLVPDWLQTALLTVLLLFVINKTVRKGIKQWRQEQRAVEQKRKADELAQVRACFQTLLVLGE